MKEKKGLFSYFTKTELILWAASVILIFLSFILFDRTKVLTLIASLIGVTSLILCAKGNPIGQILMIAFCILYGIISFRFQYYGEMITYLAMSMPMAVFSLISWFKNPFQGNRSEVKVNRLSRGEVVFSFCLSAVVTVVFYFILKHFNTANLFPSTLSVTTSFLAAYYTFRRSPFYALAYAFNDVVLVVLWVLASFAEIQYLSVVMCFVAFLANDLYGFISWRKMGKRQARIEKSENLK